MPRIDIAKVATQQIASYPKEFAPAIFGREKRKIGDAAGLTQFGGFMMEREEKGCRWFRKSGEPIGE